MAWFFGGTVVIGDEIDRARIHLVQQQGGDFGQTGFGVAHGGSAIPIAAAEVALPVDQGVTLRKVLRHPHQGIVSRLIAVWVKAPEHIPHHAGAFDRLGSGVAIAATKPQAHAGHAVQNAPLYGLLSVAHVWQGAAFDDGEGIFQIRTLGVSRQIVLRA